MLQSSNGEHRAQRTTIETLAYVKKLEAAGIDRKQAEAHAAAIRDTLAGQVAAEAALQAVADRPAP
jgi:hypothetical protein